jgi:lipopolysaccharide biosynthesis regulator YciM
MRKLFISLLVLASLAALAKKPETIEELVSRLQSADKNKQVELYMQLAKLQIEAADQSYNTNVDKAKKLIEEGTQSAEKAGRVSLETGKHMKQIEIDLRKLEKRMEDIRRSWAVEDREPIGPQIRRVEAVRSSLLDRMFSK